VTPRVPAVAPPPAQRAPPKPPARSPSTPAERPRESRSEPPEQAYGAALTTFRAREHGQAVLDFLDFIATYPRHPLVANAQYWIGEAYYAQRDYRQALAEFQKVAPLVPGSPKVPMRCSRSGSVSATCATRRVLARPGSACSATFRRAKPP
jgi:TolA-binding protein